MMLLNKIQDKITDITNLGSNNTPIAKANMVKNKIPNINSSEYTQLQLLLLLLLKIKNLIMVI